MFTTGNLCLSTHHMSGRRCVTLRNLTSSSWAKATPTQLRMVTSCHAGPPQLAALPTPRLGNPSAPPQQPALVLPATSSSAGLLPQPPPRQAQDRYRSSQESESTRDSRALATHTQPSPRLPCMQPTPNQTGPTPTSMLPDSQSSEVSCTGPTFPGTGGKRGPPGRPNL